LASAENSNPRGGTASPGSAQAPKGISVAHEVPVTATGARPGANSGKRELFTESTTTALVVSNGGVIRLATAVEPGQLLFLTNQESKREIVTQVKRRRDNAAAGYYVELEFTEPTQGFWGIDLSESPAAATESYQRSVAAEILQPSEAGSDDSDEPAPIPSASEIQSLMNEVEELRTQLISLQTQGVPAGASMPAAAAPAINLPSASAPVPPLSDLLSSFLAPATASSQGSPAQAHRNPPVQAATSTPTLESPEAEDKESISQEESPPKEAPAPEVLPAPEPAKVSKKIPEVKPQTEAPGDRLGPLRLGLLAVVSLFAVTVAAWNLHWFPFSSRSSSLSASGNSTARAALHPAAPAHPASQQKTGVQPVSGASAETSSAPPSGSNATTASAQPINSDATRPSDTSSRTKVEIASRADSAPNPASREYSEHVKSVAKRSKISVAKSGEESTASASDGDSETVPPRLLKSVRAIAPSAALKEFFTGNVTLDALIDESGHVKSMKVLSGPPSFHKAAMEALKHYRYEPARQNGKPVSAHLTVLVPFWFEP